MRTVVLLAIVISLVQPLAAQSPPPLAATEDFSRLTLKVGDTVYVTDLTSGVEVNGRLSTISEQSLSIDGYRFSAGPNLKIERRGDPIWDGAAIGFGFGSLMGLTIGAEGCLHQAVWHCVVAGGTYYGAVGALIDWIHKGRTTVYQSATGVHASMRVLPQISRDRRSVALAVSFR